MAKPHFAAPDTGKATRLGLPAMAVVGTAAAAGLYYFAWRFTSLNPNAMVLSLMLLAAEMFGATILALHAFMTWRLVIRTPPEPAPGITADIFIPTYNEPVEMLRRTVLAAVAVRHPHETWLLDDGNRPQMAALAKELGVHYVARKDNSHAKAGNLNNALALSKGDFIAIFDADHVPHGEFLDRTLGYFRDPNIAFVQTPQDFYNLDSFQHRENERRKILWTEQSLFFRVIMPGKDYWNAAFFCGSCAVARRSAILDIGGFATETVTEDLHTSLRLHKKGYGSVYHGQSLAFGIAPDTFEPYESQRVRWGQGAMQVWRQEGILTARGLTWAQRFCYLASVITYFDGWQKAFMYFLPSFVLMTGILPMQALNLAFVAHFLPWMLMAVWATEELGRGFARSWIIEQYNFLRYPGFAFATLTFILNRRLKFRVTNKGASETGDRLRLMLPHLAVIGFAAIAVATGVTRYAIEPYMPLLSFLLNIFWVCVVAAIAVAAVRFAVGRNRQVRDTYRFRLPVPVVIRFPGEMPRALVTDDISSNGMRLRVPWSRPISPSTEMDAELILPSGRQPVRMQVERSWRDSGLHSVGFSFRWPSREGADMLDIYLYGSNAEWLMNGLLERSTTPLGKLSRLFGRGHRPRLLGQSWRTALVLPSDFSLSALCLVSEDQDDGGLTLLASRPLPLQSIALILPGDHSKVQPYRISTTDIDQSDGQPWYLHRLVARELAKDEFIEWAESIPPRVAAVA